MQAGSPCRATGASQSNTARQIAAQIRGANYIFTPAGELREGRPASEEAGCQRADTYFGVDGVRYDVGVLDDEGVEVLMGFGGNGSVVGEFLGGIKGVRRM